MKMQTHYALAMMATMTLSAVAQAQITSVGPPGVIQSLVSGGVLDEVSLVILDVSFDNSDPLANLIEATLTGDINFTPNEGLIQTFYTIRGGFELNVGQIPVHLYNVAFIADAKLVNGGGTFDAPFTDLNVGASLSQVNPNIAITSTGVAEQITGNGLEFVQGSPLMAPYILAAGETYRFDISMRVEANTAGLFNDPVSVISHEFGGTTNFDGYRLNILAAAVPEPTSLGLMGIGVLTLVRRNPRSDPQAISRVAQMRGGNL
jgi:hypothetical protein